MDRKIEGFGAKKTNFVFRDELGEIRYEIYASYLSYLLTYISPNYGFCSKRPTALLALSVADC